MKWVTYISMICGIFIVMLGVSCKDKGTEPIKIKIPYEGIVRTDTLGNIIEEDTLDWQPRCPSSMPGEPVVCFKPTYPNPAGQDSLQIFAWEPYRITCILFFCVPEGTEYFKITVNKNDNSIVKTLMIKNDINKGCYQMEWDLEDELGKSLPDGIYRVYFYATINSSPFRSYGDIRIQR